jgi:uncharacterized membrane protein YraQ (UPF0718 family)
MDMSLTSGGSFWRRLGSPAGFTAISHSFVMEWAAILRDLILGLLIAGAAGAWVPDSFWRHLFLSGHPLLAKIWGPLIGPLVAALTCVCSIGNAPLAAVLWNGGISFGGVISFIFADLIIVPLLFVYAKYYGRWRAWFLFGTFYAAMATAGYVIELAFTPLEQAPSGTRHAALGATRIQWNYTTVLNIVFLLLALALLWRFFTTGGRPMLAMMGGGPDDMSAPTGYHNDHRTSAGTDPHTHAEAK